MHLGNAQNNSAEHSISCEIPEVALLSLTSDNDNEISVSGINPLEAGNSINGFNFEQNKIWINYSSIIRNESHRRKIVAVLDGDLPEGLNLFVEASNPLGEGKGKLGMPSGLTSLTKQPSEVIGDIGSCYTGKGINNGHFLTYKIEFDKSSENYAAIMESNSSLNVIYTLTDTY